MLLLSDWAFELGPLAGPKINANPREIPKEKSPTRTQIVNFHISPVNKRQCRGQINFIPCLRHNGLVFSSPENNIFRRFSQFTRFHPRILIYVASSFSVFALSELIFEFSFVWLGLKLSELLIQLGRAIKVNTD